MELMQWLFSHDDVSVVLNPNNKDMSLTVKMFYRKNDEVNSKCDVIRIPWDSCSAIHEFYEENDHWLAYVLEEKYQEAVGC